MQKKKKKKKMFRLNFIVRIVEKNSKQRLTRV